MATIGPAMTCNGYDPATGTCASKSIPSYVPQDQADAYMSGQWQPGTAQTSPQDATTPGAGSISSIVSGFLGAFGDFGGSSSIGADIGNAGKAASSAASSVSGAVSGATSFFGLITDLPRIGTILIGGLFIAAGLFALAGGNKIIQVQAPTKGG